MNKELRNDLERRAAKLLSGANVKPEQLHKIAGLLMNIHIFGMWVENTELAKVMEHKQIAYAAFGELVTLLTD